MIANDDSVSLLLHEMLSEQHGEDFTEIVEGNYRNISSNLCKKQRQNIRKSATLFFPI